MKKKKVIYISNVNLEGVFLPGVIHKINGQEKAFRENGFETDLLYPADQGKIVLKKHKGERLLFKGGREVEIKAPFYRKLVQHYKVSNTEVLITPTATPYFCRKNMMPFICVFICPVQTLFSSWKKSG